jgi:diguanylate cyclase (GGDEF)-like protein
MKAAVDVFARLMHLKRRVALAAGVVLFVLIALVDTAAPLEMSMHSLFLLPIMLVAWNVGAFWAATLAVLSGLVVIANGLLFGHPYTSALLLFFSSLLRTGVYLLVALAIAKLIRRLYDRECTLSRTDFLTGLPNRFAFYDVVGWELERQRRFGRPLAVIYLDCDNFKQVNDELGHRVGDSLLKTVGEEITKSLRQTDLAARLGGDEYAVLLPETSGEAALGVAETLRSVLNQAMRAHGWGVTFSIGVVGFEAPALGVDQLIEIADRLMYRAKQGGKDRIAYDVYTGG